MQDVDTRSVVKATLECSRSSGKRGPADSARASILSSFPKPARLGTLITDVIRAAQARAQAGTRRGRRRGPRPIRGCHLQCHYSTSTYTLLAPGAHVHVPPEPLPQRRLRGISQPPRQFQPRRYRQICQIVRRVLRPADRGVPQRPRQVLKGYRIVELCRRLLARRMQARHRMCQILQLVLWSVLLVAVFERRQIVLSPL